MLLRIALAALAMTASVVAQCGTTQLVTAPNYVSNNGGANGGAVYFNLNVIEPSGINLCGLSINTSATAGTPITITVYRHLSITDANTLTSANIVAANWCPMAIGTGVSAGLNLPTVTTLAPALDLPNGQYAIAVVLSTNAAHRYTNGLANTNGDVNLTFTGGRATNVPFVGTIFGTNTSHRIFNGTFDYTVGAGPLTSCGTIASCVSVGVPCGGVGASVREEFATGIAFDLADPIGVTSSDILFADAGGTLNTVLLPGSLIVPPTSANLGLGDDQNTAPIALGFPFNIGGACGDTISVASNGYIWLGGVGAADFSPTAAEFTTQGARVAPYWTDLNPAAGGSVHVDLGTNIAWVTWLNVFRFGGTTAQVTAQVEITPNSILIRYDPTVATGYTTTGARLVGLNNGTSHTAPAAVDFVAGGIAPVTGAANLLLFCDARPLAGTTAVFRTTGIPAGAIAGTLIDLGAALPGLALPTPPFATGCTQYLANPNTLGLIFSPCVGTVSLAVPAGTALNGLPLVFQSGCISASSPFTTSNAINAIIGNF